MAILYMLPINILTNVSWILIQKTQTKTEATQQKQQFKNKASKQGKKWKYTKFSA